MESKPPQKYLAFLLNTANGWQLGAEVFQACRHFAQANLYAIDGPFHTLWKTVMEMEVSPLETGTVFTKGCPCAAMSKAVPCSRGSCTITCPDVTFCLTRAKLGGIVLGISNWETAAVAHDCLATLRTQRAPASLKIRFPKANADHLEEITLDEALKRLARA